MSEIHKLIWVINKKIDEQKQDRSDWKQDGKNFAHRMTRTAGFSPHCRLKINNNSAPVGRQCQ
jgi:hypothetical protein